MQNQGLQQWYKIFHLKFHQNENHYKYCVLILFSTNIFQYQKINTSCSFTDMFSVKPQLVSHMIRPQAIQPEWFQNAMLNNVPHDPEETLTKKLLTE